MLRTTKWLGVWIILIGWGATYANDNPLPPIQLLPQGQTEVRMQAPLTKSGRHPATYHFGIQDASQDQLQAWLEGDFEALEGIFSVPEENESKGQLFANVEKAIGKARGVLAAVRQTGNWVRQFDGRSLVELPVGLRKELPDGTQIEVVISRITLYPTVANLNVYAGVQTADMDRPLYFGAPDISFSRKGGIIGGSVGLLGEQRIPILSHKADLIFRSAVVENNEFKQGVGNYASLDCDGLSGFGVDLGLEFSREVLVPVDTVGRVTAELTITSGGGPGLNDMVATVNFDRPFAHPGKPDVIFTATKAVLDFSETYSSINFPMGRGYMPTLPSVANGGTEGTCPDWKGVYIQNFSVQLPKEIMGDGASDFTIGFQDVIIDKAGFTGAVYTDSILSLDQGRLGGWAFSLEHFDFYVEANVPEALTFDGKINLPIFNDREGKVTEEASVGYLAHFNFGDRQYTMAADILQDQVYPVDIIQADFTLKASSGFMVQFSPEGTYAEALINAEVEVDATLGPGNIQVPGVSVDGLVISNQQPIVNSGQWKFEEGLEADFGGFGMILDSVSIESEYGNDLALKFKARFDLGQGLKADTTEAQRKSFTLSAKGAFRILGNITGGNGTPQKWQYDDFKVDLVNVSGESEAADFSGQVVFFDSLPGFGSGFQGGMSLKLKKFGKDTASSTAIAAMGIFGNLDGEKYFMVDVAAQFASGAIPMGGVDLRGVRGGVYYHMSQDKGPQNFESNSGVQPVTPPGENENPDPYENAIRAILGKNLSGISYSPDMSVSFGLWAGVVIATNGDEEVFNANASLAMQVNKNGGLDFIKIYGFANAMAPISWTGPAPTGVSIAFDLGYVNKRSSSDGYAHFYAKADAFVNLPGIWGSSNVDSLVLFDSYEMDLSGYSYAGGLELYISKDNGWYLNVGEPCGGDCDPKEDPRISLNIGIDSASFYISTKSYLNVGTRIPAFPGLPGNVQELTRLGNLVANESSRATGSGFMFGASFNVQNEVDAFGIFQAGMELDVGFDIMLQKYLATCANTGGDEIGINGWYAAGQAWAYVAGYVKVAGYTIFDLALAAALQIKGPNPFYGQGAISGRYNIMNGLIKGKCHFPIQFGEECDIQDNGLLLKKIPIVMDVQPADGADPVAIDARPSVTFNYPVGETFRVDLNDDGTQDELEIRIASYSLLDENGIEVPIRLVWDDNYQYVELLSEDLLSPHTTYTLSITVDLMGVGGTLASPDPLNSESYTHTFTTGADINILPLTNIETAYPADGQFNFYAGQGIATYLQLKQGQDALFAQLSDGALRVRFTDQLESEFDLEVDSFSLLDEYYPAQTLPGTISPATYDPIANKIDFPTPDLAPGKAYQMILEYEHANGYVQKLYSAYFRKSLYASINEKLADATYSGLQKRYAIKNANESDYVVDINGLKEPFGVEEIIGLAQFPNALNLEADLNRTAWVNQFESYSIDGQSVNLFNSLACDDSADDYTINISGSGLPPIPRSVMGGDRPDQAVYLLQEGAHQLVVNRSTLPTINENYPAFVDGVGSPQILYLVPRIIYSDFSRATELARSRYNYLLIQKNFFTSIRDDGSFLSGLSNASVCSTAYDRDACCLENPEVQVALHEAFQTAYDNAPACVRYTHELTGPGDICNSLRGPLDPRSFYQPMTTSGNYPVIFQYQAPTATANGTTIPVTLKFLGL